MYCVCTYPSTLLKVVSYSDLNVLSISVMGSKKMLMGVGGWGGLYPVLFRIYGIYLTLQSPSIVDFTHLK